MSLDVSWHITNCDQCRSTVHYCFTYMETIRLIRTENSWWPPQLSHSSWTLTNVSLCGKNDWTAQYKLWVSCSVCLQSVLASTWGLHKFSSLNCNSSPFKFCYLTATLNSLFSVGFVTTAWTPPTHPQPSLLNEQCAILVSVQCLCECACRCVSVNSSKKQNWNKHVG